VKTPAGYVWAGLVLYWMLGGDRQITGQEIRGVLRDARTEHAVRGGEVRLYSVTGSVLARTTTDIAGEFGFRVPQEGVYGLEAVHPLFPPMRRDTVRVAKDEIVTVTLLLDTVFVLAPVTITARVRRSPGWLDVFWERRQFFEHLGARFYTRADFADMAAGTPSEVITSLIPQYFFHASPAPGRAGNPPGRPRLAIRRFNNVCEPRYYVNHHQVRIDPDARIEDFVELRHVTAIEVYRPGAARPGDVADGCGGAIIFWTVGPSSPP
jgi:hypothetical protein